jgi:multidrug efflux system membrane fusion protein
VFDNKDRQLFPAQFVNVQLLADVKAQQVVVPNVAIQHGPDGTFVYVVEQGTARMRPVDVGFVEGDRAVIAKGLTGGETVVTESTDRLRDNSRVEIRTPGDRAGAGRAAGGRSGGRR